MTVKEIYDLRRSGRLEEALNAAETEFANKADNYTAGALFWCLNDHVKQQGVAISAETIGRMQSLYTDYCEGIATTRYTQSLQSKPMSLFTVLYRQLSPSRSQILKLRTVIIRGV